MTTDTAPENDPDSSPDKDRQREQIVAYISGLSRGVTAPEISDEFDIPRTTLRGWLDDLVDAGVIETEKLNHSTRLYYTESNAQETGPWGEYTLLTPEEVRYLKTGETSGVPEKSRIDGIILAVKDHAEQILMGEHPRKEEIKLIAARGGIPRSAEDVTFMDLWGALEYGLDVGTRFDRLYIENTTNLSPEYLRSIRTRLGVKQAACAESLAEDGSYPASTYQGKLSLWENGDETQLLQADVERFVEYLQQRYETDRSPFTVVPTWLDA